MAYIEMIDSTKSYKTGSTVVQANKNVNFSIEKGELVIILGTSGAGKSTVLNILGGMDKADKGSIVIDGQNIAKYSDKELTNYRRHDVGFVFQFYNLVPNLTTLENVELATEISKNPLNAKEVLEAVGLKDRMSNFPSQLSGGEQQRAAIARAIAKNPKLLLCDEPTGALDYNTGKQILKLLQSTTKDFGANVVVITHNKAIAPMADRLIEINDAKVRNLEINSNPISVDLIEW